MPTYSQWLSENEEFRLVERKLRLKPSIMTGRIRSLDEVRQHVIDQWNSPLAQLSSCFNGLFWIEWALFLFTFFRFWLNIIVIINNYVHRPCAFGDHYRCVEPAEGNNWYRMEYIVSVTEASGLLLLVLVVSTSIITFSLDCGHPLGGGRPRALHNAVMAIGAVISFSMLYAVRLFQPHQVGAALRRIWVLKIAFIFKVLLSGLLLALVPLSVVVVFAKLSQLEQVLGLHFAQWRLVPEYMTFFGFLNQLLGITDSGNSESSVILDMIFLGEDAKMSEKEKTQMDFIMQTVYLEAIAKWGWTGLIFMVNLSGSRWQRIFVIEDSHHDHDYDTEHGDFLNDVEMEGRKVKKERHLVKDSSSQLWAGKKKNINRHYTLRRNSQKSKYGHMV